MTKESLTLDKIADAIDLLKQGGGEYENITLLTNKEGMLGLGFTQEELDALPIEDE